MAVNSVLRIRIRSPSSTRLPVIVSIVVACLYAAWSALSETLGPQIYARKEKAAIGDGADEERASVAVGVAEGRTDAFCCVS